MGLREEVTGLPSWVRWLLALLPLRIALIPLIPVLPEEAYHWNYARHLDWAYYDHPPMIAWAIAAGRAVFGDTSFGIRSVTLLFSLGASILLARLASRFYGPRAAVWAVILFTLSPVALPVSEAGFPDSPLLFFWSLAMTLIWGAIEGSEGRRWLGAGVAVGLAMLSKYTAVMLGPGVLLYLVCSKEHRRWLWTPWPYLGTVAAAVVFTPVIYWNWTHHWASFLFQSKGRLEESTGFRPLSAIQFVGIQGATVFAAMLPLAVAAIARLVRTSRPEERFLGALLAPIFLAFFAVSFYRNAHVLWPLPGYLGLLVVMAGVVGEGESRVAAFYARWRNGFLVLSAVGAIVVGVHLAFFLPWISPFQGPYGWAEVAVKAREVRSALPPSAFYLAWGRKYTCASQLAYHLNLPEEVHGDHLIGTGGLQYQYWCEPESVRGRDAVIVVESPRRSSLAEPLLRQYFDCVERAGEVTVPVGRRTLRREPPLFFQLFIGRGYRPPGKQ